MKSKSILFILALALVALMVSLVIALPPAKASDTPVFDSLTIPGTWTNSDAYTGLTLDRIEVFSANATTGTVTVTRIRDTRTNTVCSITLAASAGSFVPASTNAVRLKPADKLVFALSGGATNAQGEVTTLKPNN